MNDSGQAGREEAPPPGNATPAQHPQAGAPQAIPAQRPTAPRPGRTLGTGAIIAIAAGGLALLTVIALVIAVAVVPKGSKVTSAGPDHSGAPADVARDFMAALAKSDAKTALSYISQTERSPYVTDQMLRASNKLAPIRKVTIGKVTGATEYQANVPVSYSIGDEPFRTTLKLFTSSSDGWQVQLSTVRLYVDPFLPLGLTLNGVKVTGKEVRVLPGAYELKLSNKNYTIEGTTTFTVGFGDAPSLLDSKVALSESGLATFRQLVKSSVDACMASPNLDAGCGIKLSGASSDGTTLIEGTLSRTLSASAAARVESMKATPKSGNPLIVDGEFIGSVETTGQCLKDGQQGACKVLFGGTGIGRPTVSFDSETPVVRWDGRSF